MDGNRSVWIVGDPGEHLPKTDPRYHRGDCYVLEQGPNRGRAKRVRLSGLPATYGPCQICAPGARIQGGAPTSTCRDAPDPSLAPRGVQLGQMVDIEDLDIHTFSTVQIVSARRERQPGQISAQSPLGAALLGKDSGSVIEFNSPKGRRRVRIVNLRAETY